MLEKKERNIEIYRKWQKGKTQFQLAIEYKCTPSNIARIVNMMKTKPIIVA